ncbi:hypothetical protein Hte_012385 [Hypoxylon texense]
MPPFEMGSTNSTDYEEDKPFLSSEGYQTSDRSLGDRNHLLRIRFLKTHSILFAFHAALLFLNVVLFIRATTSTAAHHAEDGLDRVLMEKTFSPADSAIRYTAKDLEYEQTPSPFVGKPRPELDHAWTNLLRSTMVRISEGEMKRMNKTSITLQDGSGYVGYLESHHMLHCVVRKPHQLSSLRAQLPTAFAYRQQKRFYESRYPEHYADVQADNGLSDGHLDHCVEVLRQGIMCNADVTINTFFWENPNKIDGNRAGPRKCVDWSRLQAWADERSLGLGGKEAFLTTLIPSDDPESMGPMVS